MKIDLNSDMGEGFGVYQVCNDQALMSLVSSANIACGFHAGDPQIMTKMVRLAKQNGVAIGAHPGLPDKQGFGRKEMSFSHDEVCQIVLYQVGALYAIAKSEGMIVNHVSFHAALGNMINRDEALASRVMDAIFNFDSSLTIFAMPDSIIENAAKAKGLKSLTLFLADRAYTDKGGLVPRGTEGALVKEEPLVRARVRQFLKDGTVTTLTGNVIAIRAKSILVHSDTPGSEELLQIIRSEIEAGGDTVTPASQLL